MEKYGASGVPRRSDLSTEERNIMPVTKEPVYASQARPWLASYEPKFRDMPTPDCTAFDYICRQNKNHLSDIALMYYGNQITYATLFVQVKKTAAALRAAGVAKGDIITGVSVMTPELIYLFYAADMVGATLNLVDPRYSPDGIHEYIQEARSKLLICLNICYDKCHQALRRTTVEKVLVFSPADSLKGPMNFQRDPLERVHGSGQKRQHRQRAL